MLYVQKRGRWASEKSVRRYAKEGILQEAWTTVPENVRHFCMSCAQNMCGTCRAKVALKCYANDGLQLVGLRLRVSATRNRQGKGKRSTVLGATRGTAPKA